VIHVRSIPWLKRLFSDTGLHLNAIRCLAVPIPQQKRVGRASVACTGRCVGRDADPPWRWLKPAEPMGPSLRPRDDQTTENQRLVLAKVAQHRDWLIVQTYEDQGISGAKGREQRPAFDTMLKDAVRRRFDVLMVWSIDRLGRSVLHVANALAELDAAGVALYSDQQAIDSTTPTGRAMIQMASVFGEQERQIIRSRVLAGLDRVRQQGKKLGRPKVSPKVEDAIRRHLSAGNGILKVAALVGVGSGTVQRVKREMAVVFAEERLSARNQRFAGQVLVTVP
jgi:DNA invertase Pin-like site-specific DNA recombinase